MFEKIKDVLKRTINLNQLKQGFWDYFLYSNKKDFIITYYGIPIAEIRFYRGIKNEEAIISRIRQDRERAKEEELQERL